MTFVLDCSVTMTWVFEDETKEEAEHILRSLPETGAFVPPLWFYEVSNVLVSAERRKRLTKADSNRFITLLLKLPINVDHSPLNMSEVMTISRDFELSAYDSTYLELSLRTGLPLATFDQKLIGAAQEMGVKLYS